MKVEFISQRVENAKVYKAGDTADLNSETANNLIAKGIAKAVKVAKPKAETKEEKPKKKTTKKKK